MLVGMPHNRMIQLVYPSTDGNNIQFWRELDKNYQATLVQRHTILAKSHKEMAIVEIANGKSWVAELDSKTWHARVFPKWDSPTVFLFIQPIWMVSLRRSYSMESPWLHVQCTTVRQNAVAVIPQRRWGECNVISDLSDNSPNSRLYWGKGPYSMSYIA